MLNIAIAGLITILLILAFFPAMIAAKKKLGFSKWYIYGLFLFPFALKEALSAEKNRHIVRVYAHKGNAVFNSEYRDFPVKSKSTDHGSPTNKQLVQIVLSKGIFAVISGIMLLGALRTFCHPSAVLRLMVSVFAVTVWACLCFLERFNFSRIPLMANEIINRLVRIVIISAIASLPLQLLKKFVFIKLYPQQTDFWMFLFTIISFFLFAFLLLRQESIYYARFDNFFDYCGLSLLSYAAFSSITLVLLSVIDSRIVYYLAMSLQFFDLNYIEGSGITQILSSIYSAASVHFVIELIILASGLLCLRYKNKEKAFRVEYRSHAVRMSHKPILRRHIK